MTRRTDLPAIPPPPLQHPSRHINIFSFKFVEHFTWRRGRSRRWSISERCKHISSRGHGGTRRTQRRDPTMGSRHQRSQGSAFAILCRRRAEDSGSPFPHHQAYHTDKPIASIDNIGLSAVIRQPVQVMCGCQDSMDVLNPNEPAPSILIRKFDSVPPVEVRRIVELLN